MCRRCSKACQRSSSYGAAPCVARAPTRHLSQHPLSNQRSLGSAEPACTAILIMQTLTDLKRVLCSGWGGLPCVIAILLQQRDSLCSRDVGEQPALVLRGEQQQVQQQSHKLLR